MTLTKTQVHHDAWAKLFVWPFVEERFASSASLFRTTEYEVVRATGDVALSYIEEYWVHPSKVGRYTAEIRKLTATELHDYRPLRRFRRRLFSR